MTGNGERRTREGASALQVPVRPGALTELLAELARAPEGAGWDAPLLPAQRVGRFEIVREVGRGGFGVVYEARDTELSRSVAFKAIRSSGGDAARESRLLAEAEAAARLAHPNIVHLYDLGRCEQGPYLILELLQGRTLAERLEEGPLPLREAVRVAVEMTRGVAHAHGQGVVHRDLKPGNVFLCEDGQVKVLDFGLAHVFGRGGADGGTPAYMAPEQARGEAGDARADVYSLGVVLEELRTGVRPAEGSQTAPPVAGRRGRAERALARLAAEMRSADPALRPADAGAALQPLLAIQRSLEPRRALWAGLAVALLAVLGAGIFAYAWQRPLPEGRLLTALADTDNATGDADLDAVSELFRLGLEQSRRVSVMARSRLVNVLREASGPAPGTIGEPAARLAAERSGAQLLLSLEVRRKGEGYEISTRALDVARRLPAFALREEALAKAGVTSALDRLLGRVRRALGDRAENAFGRDVRIAQAAPASPEAWRHYGAWVQARSVGDFEGASRALEQLLAADPEFPMARLHQALFSTNTHRDDLEKRQAHVDAALRGVGRVPPKERALLEAMLGPFAGGSMNDRRRALENAAATWPEDAVVQEFLGQVLLAHHADLAGARPHLEKALAIAPLPPQRAIAFLGVLGRLDEALARARDWAERYPGKSSLHYLSAVHRWRGEPAEAVAAARRSLGNDAIGPGLGRRWAWLEADAIPELESVLRGKSEETVGEWLATRGRWREALAALDEELPPDAAAAGRAWHHWLRLDLLATVGAPEEALWREAEGMLRNGGDMLGCAAVPFAVAGYAEAARRLAERAEDDRCGRAADAFGRRARGDLEGALRRMQAVTGVASLYFRGLFLAELGRNREAVEAFRAYRRAPDLPDAETYINRFLAVSSYARSLYHEAAALDRLGEREEARRALGRLFRLWDRADPDLPLLAEARALRQRLAAEGAAR